MAKGKKDFRPAVKNRTNTFANFASGDAGQEAAEGTVVDGAEEEKAKGREINEGQVSPDTAAQRAAALKGGTKEAGVAETPALVVEDSKTAENSKASPGKEDLVEPVDATAAAEHAPNLGDGLANTGDGNAQATPVTEKNEGEPVAGQDTSSTVTNQVEEGGVPNDQKTGGGDKLITTEANPDEDASSDKGADVTNLSGKAQPNAAAFPAAFGNTDPGFVPEKTPPSPTNREDADGGHVGNGRSAQQTFTPENKAGAYTQPPSSPGFKNQGFNSSKTVKFYDEDGTEYISLSEIFQDSLSNLVSEIGYLNPEVDNAQALETVKIRRVVNEKIKDFVHKKRMEGDTFYTIQNAYDDLFLQALSIVGPIPQRPDSVREYQERHKRGRKTGLKLGN